jgi:hypothetical protein
MESVLRNYRYLFLYHIASFSPVYRLF